MMKGVLSVIWTVLLAVLTVTYLVKVARRPGSVYLFERCHKDAVNMSSYSSAHIFERTTYSAGNTACIRVLFTEIKNSMHKFCRLQMSRFQQQLMMLPCE